MKKFLRQLNIAPNTLVGLIVVLVGYLTLTLKWARTVEQPEEPVGLVFKLKDSNWLTKLILGFKPYWLGLTLGQVIFMRDLALQERKILSHEIVHIRQQSKLGLIFFLTYTWSSIMDGYWGNKYELEAYKLEDKN
jgi:hypothetical protein